MENNLSTSITAYSDIREAFDLAVERGGLVVELPTVGKAINFKQRANRFRNLERARQAEMTTGIPGHRPEIVYDTFEIVFEPPLNEKKMSERVRFRPRSSGKFFDPETGDPIT